MSYFCARTIHPCMSTRPPVRPRLHPPISPSIHPCLYPSLLLPSVGCAWSHTKTEACATRGCSSDCSRGCSSQLALAPPAGAASAASAAARISPSTRSGSLSSGGSSPLVHKAQHCSDGGKRGGNHEGTPAGPSRLRLCQSPLGPGPVARGRLCQRWAHYVKPGRVPSRCSAA